MVTKCTVCNKTITKKSPGLECSRCNKHVHATTACAAASEKQLAALRAANNLEWNCSECSSNMNRSSIFIPEEDQDDLEDVTKSFDGQSSPVDIKKLLQTISVEIRKIIKEEMASFQHSVEYLSEQYDDLKERSDKNDEIIKQLKNSNTTLKNTNTNLEHRISAIEQRLQEYEHQMLTNYLEIDGIPKATSDNLNTIAAQVASQLSADEGQVESIRRGPPRGERPGIIIVKLNSKSTRNQWLAAAKTKELVLADVLPSAPKEDANKKIYIREALTPHLKKLLWQAKQQLKTIFKYIWCRDGKILLKKEEKGKIHTITNVNDIKSFAK